MRRTLNLRDEHGFALVFALGSLLVLSVVLTVALEVSSSSGRHANRTNADEKAYRLAEAGLNNAVAVIAEVGADTVAVGPTPTGAGDTNAHVQSLNGGTATWGGTYDASTMTWTITSFGSVANPAGSGSSAVTRKVTGTVKIVPPSIVFAALNSTTEKHTLIIRSGGDLTVNNAIYVNTSNGDDGFDIKGTGGSLKATSIYTHGGWETADSSSQVWVGGTQCGLSGRQFYAPTTGPGCPVTGAAIQADPFATTPLAPTAGAAACSSALVTPTVYAPNQQLNLALTNIATTLQSKGGAAIAVNDVIRVDSEQMLVTALTSIGGGKYNVTVTRAYNSTTAAAHAANAQIVEMVTTYPGTAATPTTCTISSGTVGATTTLAPGTYYGGICIGAADCSGTNCVPSTAYSTTAYSPAQKLSGAITNSATSIVANGTAVSVGDVILIDSERMYVSATAPNGGGETLTVTRAYLSTTAAAHANNANIVKVNIPADVTLGDGTYIIAGGGFRVCGAANLHAPHVMLYNTNDQVGATEYAAIDQILLNTTGSVTLGPQTTGTYAGMTIFQNRTMKVDPTGTDPDCDHQAQDTAQAEWDIGFASMASSGADGALGSVTGTIYAANDHALFTDKVSGTSNLAVMTGCIYIDGSTSTFNFDTSGLYGNGLTFLSQSG